MNRPLPRLYMNRNRSLGAEIEPRLPTRHESERYLLELKEALRHAHRRATPAMHCVVWPAGLDPTVIPRLPLAVRTRNAFGASSFLAGDDALTAQDVMRLQNFGRKSLTDLLLGLETFLNQRIRDAAPSEHSPDGRAVSPPIEELRRAEWERAGEVLAPLLAAAIELYGARSLTAALHPSFVGLASKLGIASDIEGVALLELVGETDGPAVTAMGRLDSVLENTSVAERATLLHRILGKPPKTLEDVGELVGVTRERIRQVQVKLDRKIRAALGQELTIIASVLKEHFAHIAWESDFEERIEALVPAAPDLPKRVFRHALISKLGFTLEDGVYFDRRVHQFISKLGTLARGLADDVGLVEESRLVSKLPFEDWQQFWPWLCANRGFHNLFGILSIRDSTKARTKAALLSIGRPATRAEIGRLCGVEETRVGAHLSNVPSVVRADKDRWGLKEWIDDEYDGIVGEIIQRINEDGGATTTERLMRELPTKFNVSASSVRAYMYSRKFEIRDGLIRVANVSSLQLRQLDDVIDGRDAAGAPYWTFAVEDRFSEGYSVTGVPPEFAKAIGCEPEGIASVRMANFPDCRDLSLSWRLASTTGVTMGYVATPLERLGLRPGQRARVTIRGPLLVELTQEPDQVQQPSGTDVDAILAQMKRRRRAL